MTSDSNRRGKHRRFSDRRIAMLLEIHEILFDEPPGQDQDKLILEAMIADFDTHVGAFVSANNGKPAELTIQAVTSNSNGMEPGRHLTGPGIRNLIDAHEHAQGAITLTRFRRPSLFEESSWEKLWSEEMGLSASALLAVPVRAKKTDSLFVWLLLSGITREWSSHDRQLAEEIADLLSRATDKAMRV